VALVVLVAVLVMSSLRRYVFSRPFGATEEVVAALFVAVAFLPLTYVLMSKQQIRLELLWRQLPGGSRHVATMVGQFLTVIILSYCIDATWRFAKLSLEIGAVSETVDMPIGPWMTIIPFALTLMAVTIGIDLLRNLTLAALGRGDMISQPIDCPSSYKLEQSTA
jgi:TRAP-type C4-dicarboxylate transport system permease small subunit